MAAPVEKSMVTIIDPQMMSPSEKLKEIKSFDETILNKHFKIKKTQIEMMKDRGYIPVSEMISSERIQSPDYSILNFSNDISALIEGTDINSLETFNQTYHKEGSPPIYIIYPVPYKEKRDKFSAKRAQQIIIKFRDPQSDTFFEHVIIIDEGKLDSAAQKVFDQDPTFKVEFFSFNRLRFNITKHFLVPQHRLMTREERNRLIAESNINAKNYERIALNDAISRYYGASVGDMFEITRNNVSHVGLFNNYRTYRIVEIVRIFNDKKR